METIKEFLPFIIPLLVAEIILLTVTLRHIFTRVLTLLFEQLEKAI